MRVSRSVTPSNCPVRRLSCVLGCAKKALVGTLGAILGAIAASGGAHAQGPWSGRGGNDTTSTAADCVSRSRDVCAAPETKTGQIADAQTAPAANVGTSDSRSSLPERVDTSEQPLGFAVNVGLTYDDNVSRARTAEDKLSSQSLGATASKVFLIPLSGSWQILLNGFAGGDAVRTYTKLSRLFVGLHGEIRYRHSSSFFSPTLALFSRISGEEYGSDLRRGYRYSFGASMEQPLTDRITLSGSIAHNRRDAKSAVFDLSDNAVRLNLDYATVATGSFYVSAEYHLGDTVSSGRMSLASIDIAEVFVRDDAFNRSDFFSYRTRARTVFASIGYSHPVGEKGSLDFSWRYAHVTPTATPNFPGAGNSPYTDNQFTVAYQMHF